METLGLHSLVAEMVCRKIKGLEAWDDIMWLKEFFLVFPVRAACYWTKYSWSSFILGLLKVPFIFLKYLFYTLILIFNRKSTQ